MSALEKCRALLLEQIQGEQCDQAEDEYDETQLPRPGCDCDTCRTCALLEEVDAERTLLAAKERRIERMGAALQMARLYFVDHSMEAMQIDRALSTPSTETEGDL